MVSIVLGRIWRCGRRWLLPQGERQLRWWRWMPAEDGENPGLKTQSKDPKQNTAIYYIHVELILILWHLTDPNAPSFGICTHLHHALVKRKSQRWVLRKDAHSCQFLLTGGQHLKLPPHLKTLTYTDQDFVYEMLLVLLSHATVIKKNYIERRFKIQLIQLFFSSGNYK